MPTETTAAAEEDPKPADAEPTEGDDTAEESPYAEFITQDATHSTIAFRGRKFVVPRARSKWPTRAMQLFQRGVMEKFPDAVELMLGSKQWDEFNTVAPLVEDFWEFFLIFSEAIGMQRLDQTPGQK